MRTQIPNDLSLCWLSMSSINIVLYNLGSFQVISIVYLFAHSCFTSDPRILYGTFLGPILVVIVFNFVIFFCILAVLSKHTKKKYKRAVNPRRLVMKFVINIFGIVSLYGFTWLSAFLVATQERTANYTFQVIFTVLNSLQGFFLFIFFCVISKDSRDAWKGIICRGRPRSKSTNKQSSSGHTDKTASTLARRRHGNTMLYSTSTMERRYTGADSMMGTLERRPSTGILGTSSVVSTLNRTDKHLSSMPPAIAEELELNNEYIFANENTEIETECYITGPTTSPIIPMDAEEGGASVIENVAALINDQDCRGRESGEYIQTDGELNAEEGGASVIENVEALINDQDCRGRESGEHIQTDGELNSNPFAHI